MSPRLPGFRVIQTSRTPRSSVVAVLVTVALYGLGSVAELVHFALARHEICLEHGELVHVGHDHRPGADTAPSDRTAPAPRDTPESDDHDHCDIAAHVREGGLAAPGPVLLPIPPAADRAHALPADRPYLQVATLQLAPKHSPPATA